jgi:hypothetical protein
MNYKEYEFLHISPIGLLILSILNIYYKKKIIVHIHNDFINSFIKNNFKFLVRRLIYIAIILISYNTIFISQNKYVKLLDKTLTEFLNKNGTESLSKILKQFLEARSTLLDKAE